MELVLRYLELAGETGLPVALKDFENVMFKLGIVRGSPEHFVLAWSDLQMRQERGEPAGADDLLAENPAWADQVRGMTRLDGLLRGVSASTRSRIEEAVSARGWSIGRVLKDGRRFLTALATREGPGGTGGPVVLKAGFGASSLRFLKREFLLGRTLSQSHFLRPLAIEASEDVAWTTMELATGGSLDRAAAGLPASHLPALWLQAARALADLHERMVCHNDIKASNLFLDGDPAAPRVRLGDLQLATREGKPVHRHRQVWDHPDWEPGSPARRRDDVYRLAMTFAWILDPEIAEPACASHQARLERVHRMPEPLRKPLSHCLAAEPIDRIDTGMELVRLLRGAFAPPQGPRSAVTVSNQAVPGGR